MYKVLTRQIFSKKPFKTFQECDSLEEALAIASRLEKNADTLETVVELPDNELQRAPLELMA